MDLVRHFLGSSVTEWCALGVSQQHLVSLERMGPVLSQAGAALRRLQLRADAAGFDLSVVSGYRDYGRQLAIFNGKARCARKVTDDQGRELQRANFDDEAWLHAILRFSALPGASRHHWGTDFDVCDRRAVDAAYAVQLEPAEYAIGGPFSDFSLWLDMLIAADDAEGFYRPYNNDSGGVAPEAWHISFRPAAEEMAALVTNERLLELWRCAALDSPCQPEEPLAMIDLVEPQLHELLNRYFVK